MSMVGQTREISLTPDRARDILRSRRVKFIKRLMRLALVYGPLIFGAVLFTAPFLWMLGTSQGPQAHLCLPAAARAQPGASDQLCGGVIPAALYAVRAQHADHHLT